MIGREHLALHEEERNLLSQCLAAEHLLCQVWAKSVVCGFAFGPDDSPLSVMLLLSLFCIRRLRLKVFGLLTQGAATSSRAESVSKPLDSHANILL